MGSDVASTEHDARTLTVTKRWNNFCSKRDEVYFKTYRNNKQGIPPNITVINDDMTVGGSKGRFLYDCLPMGYNEYVYACSLYGSDQITLATTIKLMNMNGHGPSKAVLFVSIYDQKDLEEMPYTKLAVELGAVYRSQKKNADLIKAATEYVAVHIVLFLFWLMFAL
jgi:hypothetical protein